LFLADRTNGRALMLQCCVCLSVCLSNVKYCG